VESDCQRLARHPAWVALNLIKPKIGMPSVTKNDLSEKSRSVLGQSLQA